jgi:hypothetical protein
MGLSGSKQQKEINIKNPEPEGQVFVTQNAIDNVVKSAEQATNPSNGSATKQKNSDSGQDARVLADLSEKRLVEYEKNMLANFEKASVEVDNLFRERYQTVPVCLDLQKNVSACYTENKSQPLKCLDITNQFIKCIEKERQSRFGLTASSS